VVELLRRLDGPVLRRVRTHDPSDIGLSAIALHELYYGAFESSRQEQNVALVDGFRFEVVEFDAEDSRQLARGASWHGYGLRTIILPPSAVEYVHRQGRNVASSNREKTKS